MLQPYNEKNAHIKVWVGDGLVHRDDAKVSVFDSTVQGGDAVWEGLRVYEGKVFCLEQHLDRMEESAHALAFAHVPSRKFIRNAIKQTLEANDMHTDVHIRLTLSRGLKTTSGMDPRLNIFGSTLIVLAEHKPLVYDQDGGLKVVTSAIRRNNPQFLDSKMHHNNLLNNILAKIQANMAGADVALQLDEHGFASELNDTNIFIVRKGKLVTPFASNCLPGITRQLVINVAEAAGISVKEANISLTEIYTADEFFCTGTMGELAKIKELDGRAIINKEGSNLIQTLRDEIEKIRPTYLQPFT